MYRHSSNSALSLAVISAVESLEARQLLSVTLPSFAAPTSLSTSGTPTAVVTDDFNQDGNEDVAIAQSNNSVSVFLGNGDGTFSPAQTFATGANPTSIATGDFNNDGADDIVTADAGSGDISILIQNTDSSGDALGTFAGPSDIHVETPSGAPMYVAVGDFNNDGNLDIAVAGKGGLYVLSGNGDGTFSSPKLIASGDFSGGVVADNFTDSGNLDLAALNPATGTVEVFPGNGDGTFGSPESYSVATGATSIDSYSFRDDGVEDIAVAVPSQNEVQVLLQNETTVTLPDPIVDPLPVAAAINSGVVSGSNTVASLPIDPPSNFTYQQGTGTFASAITIPLDQSPDSLTIGDVAGTRNGDIVTANASDNSVTIIPGNGDGTFGTPVDMTVGSSPVGVAIDSFTSDGSSDLVTANAGDSTASVVLQQTSDLAVSLSASSPNAIFGSNYTYTATITNNGPGAATAVQFDDYLPDNENLVSATSTAGTIDTSNSGDVSLSADSLAAGQSITVTITVIPTQYGDGQSSAWVSSDTGDNNYDNNNASLDIPVTGSTGAEVALTSSSSQAFPTGIPIALPLSAAGTVALPEQNTLLPISFSGFASVGQNYTFTFTINNYGPDTASGLTFTDMLPTNATFVSATASQGTVDTSATSSGQLTANIGDLASGASATVNITVIPNATGRLSSAASVTATDPSTDPYSADNSATFSTYVYGKGSPLPLLYSPIDAGGTAVQTLVSTKTASTQPPTIGVSPVKKLVTGKGTTDFTFTVKRSGNLTGPSSVDYTTVAGSGDSSARITPESGTLDFAAGASSETVTVPVKTSKKTKTGENFRLALSNASNATIKSASAPATLQIKHAKPSASHKSGNPFAGGVRINFQPTGVKTPAGYIADTGKVFGAQSNQLTFGWSTNNSTNAVQTHLIKNPLLDTYNVLGDHGASNWQISLPDGKYKIQLAAGAANQTSGDYSIDANGQSILTGSATTTMPFVFSSTVVSVTKGVLTLTPGTGSLSDPIDDVKIQYIGAAKA